VGLQQTAQIGEFFVADVLTLYGDGYLGTFTGDDGDITLASLRNVVAFGLLMSMG
jgi:hypothetical protein